MVKCFSKWHAKNLDCTDSLSDIWIVLFIIGLVSDLSLNTGERKGN